LGIGFAAQTRFNASLKGIAGVSFWASLGGGFMSDKDNLNEQEFSNSYAALGTFIAMCSTLEAALHICLKVLLHVEDSVERLLVGEPRLGDLVTLVKSAAQIQGMSDDLYELVKELGTMTTDNNKIRQVVAHKPLMFFEGEMLFHNSLTAKTEVARYFYKCSAERLFNQAMLTGELATSWMFIANMTPPIEQAAIRMIREKLASLRSKPLPAIPSPPPPPKLPKQPRQPPASPT
jgi:hypothetical protein